MQRDDFCKYLEDVIEQLSDLKKAVEDNDTNKVYGFINILRTTCANLPNRIQDCHTRMQSDQISRKIPHPH